MTLAELSQLYWLTKELKRDEERLKGLRTGSALSAQSLTGMPHSTGVSNPTAKQGEALADLERLLEAKHRRIYEELARLQEYLDTVDDSLTRLIMDYRFVEFLTWDQVAVKVGGGNSASSVKMRVYRYLRASEQDIARGDTIPRGEEK